MECDSPMLKKRNVARPHIYHGISLPDDVLGLIGEFAPWIDDAACNARRTCKAMKSGVERTAKKLLRMDLQLVLPLMPVPLMRNRNFNLGSFSTDETAATAGGIHGIHEWKKLMHRVYGSCMGCNGSHWYLLACSDSHCFRMICEACCAFSSSSSSSQNSLQSLSAAPDDWSCANHDTRRGARCSMCNARSSCAHGHGMRRCTECRAYVCRPCRRKAPWVGLVCNDCDFFADDDV